MVNKLSTIIKRISRNIAYLVHHDVHREISEIQQREKDDYFQNAFRSLVLYSQSLADDEEKLSAIQYVNETHRFDMIPYPMVTEGVTITSGVDDELQLPYVMHKGKRLFFPKSWEEKQAVEMYKHFIENEQHSDKRYRLHAPHRYTSSDFEVDVNDVLIDVGCAEALFSLDCIDKAAHIYLVENDPDWFPPLQATFKDYWGDKVTLIPKTIGTCSKEDVVTLQELLEMVPDHPVFIKMDIEGAEFEIIENAAGFLKSSKQKIKMAVCTYHRRTDAENIEKVFNSIGFECHFSDGYILAPSFDVSNMYSFRRGVLRAQRI